ncbi:PilZ domain-containing protein [Bradyrhizobium japonicum]|uniref:PilZ domain-containing protein n=1 Tax=Bradyrhizobium japonicum TaxID=375 RepID=UPI0004169A30|nr:PilZ domain-containing protein [Bradyrhizobium japonicum]
MEEHRAAPRHRIFKAGTIEFGGGAIDCTVKNISEIGAALEVVSPLYIPDRFTLFVPKDHLKRRCRIIWRREKRIGVRFE